MFYGSYILNGERHSALYDSCEQWARDIFSPLCDDINVINFHTTGRNYSERKASARSVAVEWSTRGFAWGLSWLDCQRIADWFFRVGKRYGLLDEFRENGLC